MKTKNTRVRVKDIKHGAIIYTAHPFFGIRKSVVKSRPYMEKGIGLFFKVFVSGKYGSYESSESVSDSGISSGNSYNDRKSFFKEKQAIEYANKMKTDKGVIYRHKRHLEMCERFDTRCY